jgi:phage antirepressor YoqD-like protein
VTTDGAELLFMIWKWFKYAEKIGQQRLYNFLIQNQYIAGFSAVLGWIIGI